MMRYDFFCRKAVCNFFEVSIYFLIVSLMLFNEFQPCFRRLRFSTIYEFSQAGKILFSWVYQYFLHHTAILIYPSSAYSILYFLSIIIHGSIYPALSVDELIYENVFKPH